MRQVPQWACQAFDEMQPDAGISLLIINWVQLVDVARKRWVAEQLERQGDRELAAHLREKAADQEGFVLLVCGLMASSDSWIED